MSIEGQGSIFDLAEEGRRRRDAAIAQVDEHAEPDFKTVADTVILRIARMQATLTTDDIWNELAQARWNNQRPAQDGMLEEA